MAASRDLQLDDRFVDPVSENVDLLVRVGRLPPETLLAQELRTYPRVLVASPACLRARGEPKTPEARGGTPRRRSPSRRTA